jgi:hypothetical protein
MPYGPCFELLTFDALGHSWKRGVLNALVETLIAADRGYLRDYPNTPHLYRSGVVYEFNRDRWQDIPSCLMRKTGDCKDLSAWLIAWYREHGEPEASPDVTVRTERDMTIYHIRVRRKDGSIEDPSRVLGMGRRIVA